MPDVLTIPAELTPVLRREAIDRFGQAAERVHTAVETLLAAHDNSVSGEPDERAMQFAADLCAARAALADHEALLDELADDIYTQEVSAVELNKSTRAALAEVLDQALNPMEHEATNAAAVVELGRRFEGLLALRAQLDGESVTA